MQLTESAASTEIPAVRTPKHIVVIGAGAGGPQALAQILPGLRPDLPAVVVVLQQMRPGFTRVLADQLNRICSLPVHEAADGQVLPSAHVCVVPSGCVLTIEEYQDPTRPGYLINLENARDDPERLRRRVNETMFSAARVFGRNCTGILLTGTGDDGAEGMIAIARADGATIVQDEGSSVVFDLPAAAVRAGAAREVLPLWRIPGRIEEVVMGEADAAAA